MKKRFLALALCLIMLFIPILASCEVEEDDSPDLDYTALELTSIVGDLINNSVHEYNTVSRYTLKDKPTRANSYYHIIIKEDVESALDENGAPVEVDIQTVSVRDVKTGTELYSAKAYPDSEKVGEIVSVNVLTEEEYFITGIIKNGENDEDIYTYTLYDVEGKAVVTLSGTQKELSEKINAVDPDIFGMSPPISIDGKHIMALNELYRLDNGTATLVKTFVNKELFDMDAENFAFLDDKYVYFDADSSSELTIYTFDANLNYLAGKIIQPPVGYQVGLIGVLSSEKLVYVMEKKTDVEDLTEGEAYDFVLDGTAYDRDFYTYNMADASTEEIDDILYAEEITIMSQYYMDMMMEILFAFDLEFKMPDGVDYIITTDLEEQDGKYYQKSCIHLTDSELNIKKTIYDEIEGLGEYDIYRFLSNDNVILSLPWGKAIYALDGSKVADIYEEIYKITDKFIITDKGIYDHNLTSLYKLDENETVEYASNDKVYIEKYIEAEDDPASDKLEYYVYDGTAKTLIFSKDYYSVDSIVISTNYYVITKYETSTDSEVLLPVTICTKSYYFHSGEHVATFSAENSVSITTSYIDNGMLLMEKTENIDGETVYSYTVIMYKETAPAV